MTAAHAAVPTMSDMQNVCAAYDLDEAGTEYQVVTTAGGISYGTPEVDPGEPTQNVNSHPDLTAIPTPVGNWSFIGPVGRIGQSPNLFSAIEYTTAAYPELVDVQHFYHRIDTYNFSCQLQHWEVVDTVTVPGTPPEGYYTNNGTAPSNGQGSCQGINNQNPNWGEDIGNCIWTQTAPGTEGGTQDVMGWADSGTATPESLPNDVRSGTGLGYITDEFNQPTGSTLNVPGHYPAGTVAVCNSPSSSGPKGAPGSWKNQNGYAGTCSTTVFNSVGWLAGVEDMFHAYPTLP